MPREIFSVLFLNETFVEFAPKSRDMETLRTGTDPKPFVPCISPFTVEMEAGFE